MCQQCVIKKIQLEAKIANLISEVIAHNKTVAPSFAINFVALLEENGDVTVMSTNPRLEDYILIFEEVPYNG